MEAKEKLENYYLLEFPSNLIKKDELTNCHVEMAEVDSLIVGSISFGTTASDESKNALSTLEESLNNISGLCPLNSKIQSVLIVYLESLKNADSRLKLIRTHLTHFLSL